MQQMKNSKVTIILASALAATLLSSGIALPNEKASNGSFSKASFTGKYTDYKVHDDATGKNDLKVDVEVKVNKEGKYTILGYLEGVNLFDSKEMYLDKGVHKVSLTCDGNRILRNKLKKLIISDLTLITYEPSREILDQLKNLPLSTFTYEDFRRTPISIKDKSTSFEEIVKSLGLSLLLSHHKKIEPKLEKEIKEVSPEEIFEFKAISSQYKLFSYSAKARDEGLHYIAVANDKSKAFPIKDKGSFNDYISSLSLSLKDDEKLIQVTQFFLGMKSNFGFGSVRWPLRELPKPLKNTKYPIKKWFIDHPEYKFHPPKVKKDKECFSIEYYSWGAHAGVLTYQRFILRANGEIAEHEEILLGSWIGSYILI